MKIYLVQKQSYEYNDSEYNTHEEIGGSIEHAYSSKELAEKKCKELNFDFLSIGKYLADYTCCDTYSNFAYKFKELFGEEWDFDKTIPEEATEEQKEQLINCMEKWTVPYYVEEVILEDD